MAADFRGLFVHSFHSKFDVRSHRCAFTRALGESFRDGASLYLAQHRDPADLARGGGAMTKEWIQGLGKTPEEPHA